MYSEVLLPSPPWPPVPPSSSALDKLWFIISILASRILRVGPERCAGPSLQEAEEPGNVCVHACLSVMQCLQSCFLLGLRHSVIQAEETKDACSGCPLRRPHEVCLSGVRQGQRGRGRVPPFPSSSLRSSISAAALPAPENRSRHVKHANVNLQGPRTHGWPVKPTVGQALGSPQELRRT